MVGFAETNPIFDDSQSSQRREQRQTENKVFKFGFAEPHPIFAATQQSSQRREQRQTENKVLWLALPRRILSSTTVKVAKGESRDKQKTKFSSLAMPSRILSSLPRGKVAKGESREVKFTVLGYTLFQPKFDI